MIKIAEDTHCHCGERLVVERAGVNGLQFVLFLRCTSDKNQHHYVGLISVFNVLYHVIQITQATLERDFTQQD